MLTPYARRLIRRRLSFEAVAKRVGRASVDAGALLLELPTRLRRLMDTIDDNGVEVHLRERAGAGPDLVGDDLVVDLFAELPEFLGGAPLHERQRLVAADGDVVGILLAGDAELHLLPRELEQVRLPEVVARDQSAREVDDRRALHHGVVDIAVRSRAGGAASRSGSGSVRDSCIARAASALAAPARLARTSSSLGPNFRDSSRRPGLMIRAHVSPMPHT